MGARYVKLVGASSINGGPWMAIAELNIAGEPVNTNVLTESRAIVALPGAANAQWPPMQVFMRW